MARKFLYTLFVAGLLLSLFEVIYMYSSVKGKNISSSSLVKEGNGDAMKDLTGTIDVKSPAASSSILNQAYIDHIRKLDRNALTSAYATVECSGTVAKILDKPGVLVDGSKYDFAFMLEENLKNCHFLLYDADLLKATKFVESVNGVEREITYNDIQIGDSLHSIVTLNLILPQKVTGISDYLQSKVIKS